MVEASALARTLAGLVEPEGAAAERPVEPAAVATAIAWYQRNKLPLMTVDRHAPQWLRADPDFAAALAAEEAWYRTQRQVYLQVREAWLARGIDSLLFKSAGSYPSFPHLSDNLDILVPVERAVPARETLRQLGFVEVRNVEEPRPTAKFLFRKFQGGRCVCAIHVHEAVGWLVGFLDDAQLWQRIRPAADDPCVNVPSPEDAVLINLAHACYENKRLRFLEVARLRHAMRVAGPAFDWEYLRSVAVARGWLEGLAFLLLTFAEVERALYGATHVPPAEQAHLACIVAKRRHLARRLAAIRRGTAFDLPLDLSYLFCKRLYYEKILSDPARTRRERVRDVLVTLAVGVKLKSRIRPQPGLLVSVCGADGSGKTTQAQALIEALRLCEIRADYVWSRGGSSGLIGWLSGWRRRLLGRFRPGAAVPAITPVAALPASGEDALARRRRRLGRPLTAFAWAWLVALDQIATYWLRAGLPVRLGRVVVADRFVYDTAVEMDVSLPAGARWSRLAIRALLALAPRPDLGYVLDVSPPTARRRKPAEFWHANLDGERRRYCDLAVLHNLRILSTEGDLAESNDTLIREVMNTYMAGFETWLNALFLGNPSQKNPPDPVWSRGAAR